MYGKIRHAVVAMGFIFAAGNHDIFFVEGPTVQVLNGLHRRIFD
jgi:hypothetical protein